MGGGKTRTGRALSAALGRSRVRLARRPSWAEIQEYRRELDRAQKNMSKRPSAQLRWAVAFAQLDLDALSTAERESLGYDLRVLIPGDWSYRVTVGPLGDQKIRAIHATFLNAIEAQLSGRRWELPSRPRFFLVREHARSVNRVLLYWEGDEAEAIVGGLVNLLLEAGSRLRSCAECGAWLVARKRQIYCSSGCSQRMRNRRMQKREMKHSKGARTGRKES